MDGNLLFSGENLDILPRYVPDEEGGLVSHPFCGCGTARVAAQNLHSPGPAPDLAEAPCRSHTGTTSLSALLAAETSRSSRRYPHRCVTG